MTTTFPIMLMIEVDDTWDIGGDDLTDKISLIAIVGTERQVLATTTKMTGYEAKNDPITCLRHLFNDVLKP